MTTINTLSQLAEIINASEDYPVALVEETIRANYWADTSARDEYSVCSDGKNYLELDENDGHAFVRSANEAEREFAAKIRTFDNSVGVAITKEKEVYNGEARLVTFAALYDGVCEETVALDFGEAGLCTMSDWQSGWLPQDEDEIAEADWVFPGWRPAIMLNGRPGILG